MASLRTISLAALVALLACLGSGNAEVVDDYSDDIQYQPKNGKEDGGYQQDYDCDKCRTYCGIDNKPKPEPPAKDNTGYGHCEQYADQCDFKFEGVSVPTFHLIGRGDNSYGPVILDKDYRRVKVLNANGKCKVFRSGLDCRNNFYFVTAQTRNRQGARVATRTFNNIPVQEFKGKCIRLDITQAQLADDTNLNTGDYNRRYPENRRCVVFATA